MVLNHWYKGGKLMYRCNDCNRTFEQPIEWVEHHSQRQLTGETLTGSPCCNDGYEKVEDDENEEE